MNKKTQSNIMLLITSIIWGTAFVAQKASIALEPFTYTGIRNIIAAIFIFPVIFLFANKGKNNNDVATKKADTKKLLTGGILCGVLLSAAASFQQYGIYFDTDAGKSAFITTLYIIIVPIIGLFTKHKVRPFVWGCIMLGTLGFYVLSMVGTETGTIISLGDLFLLFCAFLFALHIVLIDHYATYCDGIKLSFIQFLTTGIICMTLMFIFEHPNLNTILETWFPIAYCGILSSGVGFTLQILGQKHANPTSASLILSLESVFAVVAGAIILGERLALHEVIGCAIIFVAVILAQIPGKNSLDK